MKGLIALTAAIVFIATPSFAQSRVPIYGQDNNRYEQPRQKAYETRNESRMRHSSQNYETYRNNNYQAPLGGYPDKLGNPAPRGTERPGYRDRR